MVQAKVSELEQQVDELTQRLSLLTTDKANLDSRVNILVRVLRMRDDEIAQLQQKLKVGQARHVPFVGAVDSCTLVVNTHAFSEVGLQRSPGSHQVSP